MSRETVYKVIESHVSDGEGKGGPIRVDVEEIQLFFLLSTFRMTFRQMRDAVVVFPEAIVPPGIDAIVRPIRH